MGEILLLGASSAVAIATAIAMLAASDSSSWLVLLAGAVTLVVLLASCGFGRKQVLNLPPGPRNLPVLGAIMDVKRPLPRTSARFAAKYGPIVYFRLGEQRMVVVSSPTIAQEVVKHKDLEFADRLTIMNRLAAKYVGFNGMSLISSKYDAHTKLVRKIMNTEIFAETKLREREEIRNHEIKVLVEKISSLWNLADQTGLVAIKSATYEMNRNLIFQLTFGRRFDDLEPNSKLPELLAYLEQRTLALVAEKPKLVDFFPSRILEWLDLQGSLKVLRSQMKLQAELCGEVLKEQKQLRNSTRSSNNFVDALLQLQEEGGKVNEVGIMAAMLSLVTAAMDTNALEVEWVMLELARHPKLLQMLQDEIDGVVGKERPVVETDLQALPFLNAIVTETLRLHPIAPHTLPHVNAKQETLGGYDIPPNTAVLLNIFSIGRDPKVWEDPLQFNPSRFMVNGQCVDQERWNRLNLLPFSAGRRGCPGASLGKLIVTRTVAALVHAFDWSPPPGLSAESISSEDAGSFGHRPTTSLVLTAKQRLPPGVYQSSISSQHEASGMS